MSLYSFVDLYYKPKFFLTAGALFLLGFLFLFSLPVATAITWNVDFTTVTVNNTVYWDSHPFSYLDDTYYNQSEIDDIIIGNFTANLSDYVPYTGAITDVDIGVNDFWARDGNFTRDLIVMDDFDVYDNSFFHNNVDIYGTLDVFDNSYFYGDVRIQNNSRTILEIETTNVSESAELQLNADGVNDLYIYTYGSEKIGTYYGLPKANSSYVDARGERLVVGTFDASPLYLATHLSARFILTAAGHFIPFDDDDYDIGNSSNRVKDIYVTGESLYGIHFVEDDKITIGNLSMDDNLNLLWNGNIISNITGSSGIADNPFDQSLNTTEDVTFSVINITDKIYTNFTNGSVLYIGSSGKVTEMNEAFYFEPNGMEGKLAIGSSAVMRNIFQAVKSEAITAYDNIKALMAVRNKNTNDGTYSGLSFQTLDTDGDVYSGVRIMTNFTSHANDSVSGDMLFDTRHEGIRTIKMIIDSLGNVGIGTTSPDTKFQVIGDFKSGDDNTNYLKIANDGELSLTGTARVKDCVWIDAVSIRAPLTKSATYVVHGLNGAWSFADAVGGNEETINAATKIPSNMDRSVAPTFKIAWSADGSSPGNCKWKFEYVWRALDEDTIAFAQENLTVVSSASATANGLVIAEITGIDLPSSSDQCLYFKITRLSADEQDTISDTAELLCICLEFTANKLGEAT